MMSVRYAEAPKKLAADHKAPYAPPRKMPSVPPSQLISEILAERDEDRSSAVRGIAIALLLSLPLWALLGYAVYSLM